MAPGNSTMRLESLRAAVVVLGVLLAFFALAHSLEDFAYDVPRERFDLNPTLGAVLLGGAFAGQAAVLVAAWRDTLIGYAGSFVVGVAWLAAAVLDHAGDLVRDSWREAVVSEGLVVGVIATSLLLAITSGWALLDRRR